MSENIKELVSNKKARFDYEILETFEAGIALVGTEIKSLRDNGGSLVESYVRVKDNEVWLLAASIAPYKFGNVYNHEEKRDRKLLLHKKEIEQLRKAEAEKGLAIVPLSLYLKNGRAKIKIALARGKKTFDKRAAIKERDEKRDMQRALKQRHG